MNPEAYGQLTHTRMLLFHIHYAITIQMMNLKQS